MKRVTWISGVATLVALGFGLFLGPASTKAPPRESPESKTEARLLRNTTTSPSQVAPLMAAARPPRAPEPPSPSASAAPSETLDLRAEDEARRSASEQAQLARMPVIMAIRGDYASQRERYDAMRSALERSGPTTEAWSLQAGEVFSGWTAALGASAGTAEVDSTRCFVAGCEMRVLFPDIASAERAASAFRLIPEETATHGGRVQTPAVTSSEGGVQVTWMMLRPDLMPPQVPSTR